MRICSAAVLLLAVCGRQSTAALVSPPAVHGAPSTSTPSTSSTSSGSANTGSTSSSTAAVPLLDLIDGTPGAAERLCAALKRDSVAIVELPPRGAQSIERMWAKIGEFYELSVDYQMSFGEPPYSSLAIAPPFSEAHNDDQRQHGWRRMVHDVTCLDTRLRRQPSVGSSRGQLEMLPLGIGAHDAEFQAAMMDAQDVLFAVGLAGLNCVRQSLPLGYQGSEHAVETMTETGADLAEGVTSATVHRLLLYNAPITDPRFSSPTTDPEGLFTSVARLTGEGSEVLFESHTDATWFTGARTTPALRAEAAARRTTPALPRPAPPLRCAALRCAALALPAASLTFLWSPVTVIPCASVAGIEVLTPDGWCSPETNGRPGIDVAILSGDFLQGLSKKAGGDEYPAANHRVVRPAGTTGSRLSAPLLMRAAPKYRKAIGCVGAQFDCI